MIPQGTGFGESTTKGEVEKPRRRFHIEFKPGSTWPNPTTTNGGRRLEGGTGPFTTGGTTFRYDVKATGYETLDPEIEVIP